MHNCLMSNIGPFFPPDLLYNRWMQLFYNQLFFFCYFSEGLAVGVGFGAIGKTAAATFENAR